jgi:peroxiredoxin Q/BCP
MTGSDIPGSNSMSTTLKAGDAAPEFDLETDGGERVSTQGLRGTWVVLYWDPKDDTPGCTTEACEIRDNFALISGEAEVFGISPDPVKSHQKFRDKYNLPFRLLADDGHRVADAYGVWGLKKFMGREYMGVARTTFIIDPDGKIARVFENVKPAGHALEIFDALRQLKK